MLVKLPYDNKDVAIEIPDNALIYTTQYPEPQESASEQILKAARNPINSPPLSMALKERKSGNVVVVVCDFTRPIPYSRFLPALLSEIESAGVAREEIVILIATGMHRPSTSSERQAMFGDDICEQYTIIDHRSDDKGELIILPGRSWSGRSIQINRNYLEAGFRIITGLVEPHFMAGFSGGRKLICPGLSSLETVKMFHGYTFLANPAARNANLQDNPLHQEAISIARQVGADFCFNLIINNERKVVDVFAGDLETSHEAACQLVREYACPEVSEKADVALTSSGGYPLDATFYQCVKGLVSCLPAVKEGGIIFSIGGCREGIGSLEYQTILNKYSGRWQQALKDWHASEETVKDQWEFQMQTHVLKHIGVENLHFASGNLNMADLSRLSVNGLNPSPENIQKEVQHLLNRLLKDGMTLAVIPEGPYCALTQQTNNHT